MQLVRLPKEEMIAKYMKHSKKELCEMLIECNKGLERKGEFDIPDSDQAETGKEYSLSNDGDLVEITTGAVSSSDINQWDNPDLIETIVVGDTIELVYSQIRLIQCWPETTPNKRVFKVIYSCKDGKWHKSDPIYGEIVPASEESYEFEN